MSETHPKAASRPAAEAEESRRGLPLAALRAFEASARLLSLRDAAEEIGLSSSAVSHHVRNLEGLLGARLFDRLSRGVALTDAGRALAADLGPAFTAIAQAYATAGRARLLLRLSAAPLFASRYILPNIEALNALRPGVTFSVVSSVERTDVSRDLQSMALFFGPKPGTVRAIEVAASGFVVVAAPALGHALAAKAGSLASAPLLTITGRSSHWAALFTMLGLERARREVLFDSIEGVMQAAEAGHGVALIPTLVCEDALSAGRLVQVHPTVLDNGWCYWLTASDGGPAARHLAAVARFLRDLMG